MAKSVFGLFDDWEHARETVDDLIDAGYPRDRISVISGNTRFSANEVVDSESTGSGAAATGMATGALVGGIGGFLLGLGTLAVPFAGPFLLAGPIASAFLGAGIGAAAGGLIGVLADAGVPHEKAEIVAEAIRRGSVFVAVTCDEQKVVRAEEIMRGNGAINIEEREAFYRGSGFTGYDPSAPIYTHEQAIAERQRLREVAAAPPRTATPGYREDFAGRYASSGRYEDYEPAYYYGHGLGLNDSMRDRDWDQFEDEAKANWEARYPGTWPQYRDAVRYGWEQSRARRSRARML